MGRATPRTKRTSPESANGFVVNHSHMNALVELSFTDAMRPWMSLFTIDQGWGLSSTNQGQSRKGKDYIPLKSKDSGSQPCCSAMTAAMV